MNLIKMSMAAILAGATSAIAFGTNANEAKVPIIGKSDIKIEGGRITPEALWAMGRIGEFKVSPDGKKVVYTVAYYSVKQNKSNREVFVMNADGTNNKQITYTATNENNARWIEDGKRIAFLSGESGTSQIWSMNPDGSDREKITNYPNDIEGFEFSPNEKHLLFISSVKHGETTADKYPDLPKASGRIVTDLMYKHWDEWVNSVPHPFVADYNGKEISDIKDILNGDPYESPMKPFGGIEQLAWDPQGQNVAYTCRKKTGKAYALSTNSDIFIYNLTSGETRNITEENKGYDTNPQFSPDGKMIAWQSMEHDGYESDQNRLFIMDLSTGKKTFASKNFDSNVDGFIWTNDSKQLYFTGVWHATEQIYSVSINGKTLKKLTDGVFDYGAIALTGKKLLTSRHSMSMGDELYLITPQNGKATQVTFENKHIYDQVEMGKVEQRWIKSTDGKDILTWVIFPPKFDPNKKYPTLLYCEGGPQSPVSQFWSYRWNFQMMVNGDYIVVAPNRRGMPGFGKEWNEEISGDYGGQCMKDYLSAIDSVSKEPYVNKDKLGCVGASFGGFSVYWLAGHHNKRFKAFIAHDGIFNMEQQYLETEEMWFANWDMGGAYWDKNNKIAQRTFADSPHKFVDKWDTPILCIHGEKDYRILASQGMSAFNAAKLRGIPAELLIFPDESHWVLQPQNGVLWQRTFKEWLDKWLK